MKPRTGLFLVLISLGAPRAHAWSTSVHTDMLEAAFPDVSIPCLTKMIAGSLDVDSVKNQLPDKAFMHAMRGPKEKTEAEGLERTWKYIDRRFAEARNALATSEEDSCYERGRALHPVMDSTSPAHHGHQEWSLFGDPRKIFTHGDWAQKLGSTVDSLFPVPGFPGPVSKEDFDYLDDHPQVLTGTVKLMQTVDLIQMTLSK